MNPHKYHQPALVNPPFRDDLVAAFSQQVAEVAVLDRLLPLLDGAHSLAEIYGQLISQDISPELIAKSLAVLDQLGLLTEMSPVAGNGLGSDHAKRYGSQLAGFEAWLKVRQDADESRIDAARAQFSLQQARVIIMGLGRIGSSLSEALALAGVGQLFGIRASLGEASGEVEAQLADQAATRIGALNPSVKYVEVDSATGGDLDKPDRAGQLPLLVYCPDEFREEVCEQLNSVALTQGCSLLIYRETAFAVELGPLIMPRQSACYVCYKLRRKAAEPEQGDSPPLQGPALSFSCGASLLALEIVKIVTRTAFPLVQGKLWRLGLFDGSVSIHPVLKLPRCPACAPHRTNPPRRLWEE